MVEKFEKKFLGTWWVNTLKRAPQGQGRKENMQLEACKRGKKEGEGCKRKA